MLGSLSTNTGERQWSLSDHHRRETVESVDCYRRHAEGSTGHHRRQTVGSVDHYWRETKVDGQLVTLDLRRESMKVFGPGAK